MASVTLRNIRKSFGRMEVVHGVDLDIADRAFVVFVGPSGCGKSTLLRLIAGLEDITSGDLLIDGERVNARTPRERGIAMVFQSYALYPHMNVYQNMAFGLELARTSTATIDAKIREAAQVLELTPLLDRLPRQLSGGQRQRVAIGRAIVRQPKVFLFDEPLSNLDAALRVQMRIEIARLHRQLGATMIYVTHDQVEAMTLADRIVVLNAGNIEQVGAPLDLYHRPRNLFVAGFIGSPRMNLIDSEVVDADASGARLALPGGGSVLVRVDGSSLAPAEKVTLGIRPEHLSADGAEACLSGTVELVEELGDSHLVHVRIANGQLITLRQAGDAPLSMTETVSIAVPGTLIHVFKRDGSALPRLAPTAEKPGKLRPGA
ncbi:ABC transporter ATP-binding protein [Labrys monachus]|uniref:Multiple sugar transport system ATP-binding protein n=1 Tax=Labrys monachus TaxID=217067 RepID=A0ABU0FCW6_9HYPH|nr:sn-glycerol-3-phosphate ABC transporter ATP-binding protein UgpC [Labrys monachus]MDQ0392162.1 multiple sugar transport system ATP-binding protein [Labrys monachus]